MSHNTLVCIFLGTVLGMVWVLGSQADQIKEINYRLEKLETKHE